MAEFTDIRVNGARPDAPTSGNLLNVVNSSGTSVLKIGTSAPTVTGSRGSNAALASLITQLATLGLVVDGTSS